MNSLIEQIYNAFSHPWIMTFVLAILIAYSLASRKIRVLPRIPLGLLILYFLLRLFENSLAFYAGIADHRWLEVATAAVLYCAIVRIAFSLLVERIFHWKRGVPLPKISRDFALIVIYSVIVLILMRLKGNVNLAGIITTSAVLTASIGLAAQSTLSNLLSGLSIQMDQPFTAGDWIQYGEYTGQVVAIGWKSTRIKTFEDELVIIPNLELTKTPLKNFSKPTHRHIVKIAIGACYSSPPNTVKGVLVDICRKDGDVLDNPAPIARIKEYCDSSITYEMRFAYNDYANYHTLRARIIEKIWYAFRRNGIKIPYPVMDVRHRHIERKVDEELFERFRHEVRKRLDDVPLLAPLSTADKDLIDEGMRIEEYGGGERIVVQDELGETAYIIHSGSCDVVIRGASGTSTTVANLKPPMIFGEMSLLTGAPRSATVVAHEDATVFAIDKKLFADVLTAHPSISESLADILVRRETELATIEEGKRREVAGKSQIMQKIKNFFGLQI